ncbi:hypothetical protein GGF32_007668 [Allomyces javanicus]|nr:hypothetical protein GGF32_007668 [Allomyces javanicus]
MGSDGFDELVPGLGASCGSTMLDDEFLGMFRRAVGPTIYDQVVAEHHKAKLQILRDWETQFHGRVAIPRIMARLLNAHESDSSSSDVEVELDDNELCMTTALMESLYKPIVDRIVALVTKMLDQCKAKGITVAHVLCVGGFSQSKYLIDVLRKQVPADARKIVESAHPPAAVLLGAPIFACRPEVILKQIARLTYGVAVNMPYSSSLHGPRNQLADRVYTGEEGLLFVKDGFDVVIRKGDTLVPGQTIMRSYMPPGCTQTVAAVRIYVSHIEDPVFTDTVGCDEIGKVEFKVKPATSCWSKDPLRAMVRVLHTGLVLEVTNEHTGAKVDMTLAFFD